MFADMKSDFEVKEFGELRPNYGQIIALFGSIFTFVSMVMGTIVLFTIINTMSMSVMERVNEIGMIRALGVRSGGVMLQFLTEGSLIGMSGASIGTLLAIIIAFIINESGLTWIPPGYVEPVPLTILIMQIRCS
ncbi:MAG: FtsX-like permease family protein [Desulfobacteraceae bacterium]|nr:FtsX-like permease family protein [Desulfobacteraceae bacterium]